MNCSNCHREKGIEVEMDDKGTVFTETYKGKPYTTATHLYQCPECKNIEIYEDLK